MVQILRFNAKLSREPITLRCARYPWSVRVHVCLKYFLDIWGNLALKLGVTVGIPRPLICKPRVQNKRQIRNA